MARAFVLTIADNIAAESFVDLLDEIQGGNNTRQVGLAIQEIGLVLGAHSKLEAMVAQPTVPCRCNLGKQDKGYSKTVRFGWWIHTCRKPSMQVVRDFIKNMTLGANDLLPEHRKKRDHVEAGSPPAEVHVATGPNPEMLKPGYDPRDPIDHSPERLAFNAGSIEGGDSHSSPGDSDTNAAETSNSGNAPGADNQPPQPVGSSGDNDIHSPDNTTTLGLPATDGDSGGTIATMSPDVVADASPQGQDALEWQNSAPAQGKWLNEYIQKTYGDKQPEDFNYGNPDTEGPVEPTSGSPE